MPTSTSETTICTKMNVTRSGYRAALPVAAYFTWHGSNLEGAGVTPHVEEPLSPEALWNGEDNQLKRAVKCSIQSTPLQPIS